MAASTVELYFSTKYPNFRQNIIILICEYLVYIWEWALPKSFLGLRKWKIVPSRRQLDHICERKSGSSSARWIRGSTPKMSWIRKKVFYNLDPSYRLFFRIHDILVWIHRIWIRILLISSLTFRTPTRSYFREKIRILIRTVDPRIHIKNVMDSKKSLLQSWPFLFFNFSSGCFYSYQCSGSGSMCLFGPPDP